MMKRTVLFASLFALTAGLSACGSSNSNMVLLPACNLSGTITDLSGQAVNGDALHLYIDTDLNLSTGVTATYSLVWSGGTGTGSSMSYSVSVRDVPAGIYGLLIYDDNRPGVYGYSNNPPTAAFGNPAPVNIDCGATWNLSMNAT